MVDSQESIAILSHYAIDIHS